MKNSFTILFSFLISIYSIGCDSSNSSTNSSNCIFLNESIGCDGKCSKNPLIDDACGICGGDGSSCEDLWNVFYDVDVPIAGFQFEVNEGNIINASGGAATESGLNVTNSSSTVLAFSFTGTTIPPGTGTLISLEIEGDSNSFCISNLVLSNIDGDQIDATISNCNTIIYSE